MSILFIIEKLSAVKELKNFLGKGYISMRLLIYGINIIHFKLIFII